MKKRRTKLLALALSVCLTVTAFSPVSAANETSVAASEEAAADAEAVDSMTEENTETEQEISETDSEETAESQETSEPQETPEATEIPKETLAEETPAEEEEVPEEAEEQQLDVEENVQSSVTASIVLTADEAEWKIDAATGNCQLVKKTDSVMLKDTDGLVEVTYGTDPDTYKRYYAFDASGNLLIGVHQIGNYTYNFTNSEAAVYNETDAPAVEKTPENSTFGSAFMVRETTKWYSIGNNGEKTALTGWQEIDGKKYYLLSDGSMVMNDVKKIDGTYYGFDPDGVMIVNGFCKYSSNGRTYYFGEDGTKFEGSGWELIDGSYYYFEPKGNSWTIKSGFQKIKDTDGKTYTFYFNSAGKMYKNTRFKSGKYNYYVDTKGHMKTGFVKAVIRDKNYYFNLRTKTGSNGEPVGSAITGWQKIDGYWYYFSKTYGNAQTGPVVKKIGKYYYYFASTGKCRRGGMFEFGGKKYYTIPENGTVRPYIPVNKWIKYNNKWYYATEDGSLAKGWVKIKDSMYYFNDDCTSKRTAAATYNGKKGYLDDNGKFVTNALIKLNGNYKYIDSSKGFLTNSWKTINGYKYYFKENGYMCQDLRKMFASRTNPGWYRLVVNKLTCVVTVLTKQNSSSTNYNIPVVNFVCSVGQPISRTPNGTFTPSRGGRWQMLMGPSWGQYGVNVYGGVIYFHSVACGSASSYAVPAAEFNRLGTPASHGCIRLCVSDAKWIYENAYSSKTTIHDNANYNNCLFEKPTLPKISGSVDPTDPAVSGSTPSYHKNAY
ncbi:MAG: L,D-transpeptidase family protein [Eubacteriales bacterium]|nr:L,D-transpeptidase family protein [Eubacteriales bacterium]